MPDSDLQYHQCDPDESWAEYDGQGIYLCRVCDVCVKAKLSGYRREILTGYSQEDVDDQIEPEPVVGGHGWGGPTDG